MNGLGFADIVRPLRPMCVVLTVALIIAGCGIPMDDHPRAIATTTSTTSAPSLPAGGQAVAYLYYVIDEALIPVPTTVHDRSPATVISELLKPAIDPADEKILRTALPTGTKLRSASLARNRLTIDLSAEASNVVGVSRQRALGQVVLTVTQLDQVSEVRFQIEGESLQIASPERGDVETAGACDFRSLLATDDQLGTATVSRPSLFREVSAPLVSRSNALKALC